MNWDVLEGKWKQVKAEVRSKWDKLTDDDTDLIGGKKDKLIGKLQERYGWKKDQAEREADSWIRSIKG